MKKIFTLLVMAVFLSSTMCFAKPSSGGGRSSSFGSSSFRSSGGGFKPSGGGFFKPSGGGFFKPSRQSSPSNPSSSMFRFGSNIKSSGTATSGSSTASLKLFDAFKSKNTELKAPPKHVMANDLKKIFSPDYRKSRRTEYYNAYHAPAYTAPYMQTHSSYGAWDALMMWSLLDGIGDRRMYYNHQDDPEFRQWRTDADKLCTDGNQDVCNKLLSLDKEVKALKDQGVKKQAGYITEGVDPNIYISDTVKLDSLNEIKICTGSNSSDYSRFANILAKATNLKVVNVTTNGSIDNLYKLSTGVCDMAFTQSDALASDQLVTFMQLDTKEDAMLICNKNSGVKELSDLNKKVTVYVGSDQTGSLYTFNNLRTNSVKKFGDLRPVNTELHTIAAADRVNTDDNACLFTVTTYKTPYIKMLNDTNNVLFIPIEAEQSGYQSVRMDWTKYSNLVQSNHNGWWDSGSMTPAVYPVLVTTSSWIERNPVIYYDVLTINKEFLKKEMQ